MKRPIGEAYRRELAVKASCDPRTISKAYNHQPVKGLAGHRARAILKEEGLLPLDDKAPQV